MNMCENQHLQIQDHGHQWEKDGVRPSTQSGGVISDPFREWGKNETGDE